MSQRNQDRNYSDHGWPGPTGGDSYNASPTFNTPAPFFDTVSNDVPNAYPTRQRPTADSRYPHCPPAQQQETQFFHTTDYSHQQRSEAGYQTYGASRNRASRSSSSAEPWQSPTRDVPGGSRQGQSYYQYQDPTLRSSHSVQHPHAPRIPPYPSGANPAYPAGHRPYREDDPTVEATNTHYQRPSAMSRASSDSNIWDSQGNTQLPYVRDPSTLSPVSSRVPQEASGPSTRERTDVRRSEAHNRMCHCTSSLHTEECNELEYGAKVNFGRMGFELWYRNNKQRTHSGRRNSAKSESGSRGK